MALDLHAESLRERTVASLTGEYPWLENFFRDNGIDITGKADLSLIDLARRQGGEDEGWDPETFPGQVAAYIAQMAAFLGEDAGIGRITILAGHDKSGEAEGFDSFEVQPGEIVSIVGPTGSGKSRLLADIEWVAQADTPTGRTILIDGEAPEKKWRFSSSDKLVAQLSQNMNFVMDLTVYEFVDLHAESRLVPNREKVVGRIIDAANDLAGEAFTPETAITSLSGGQSRALMIADTAILSKSPIILIDEIENAGIDRQRALSLLLSEDKIVLMATHDPILALMADRRLVIKNGGIVKVIDTTEEERGILARLTELDRTLLSYRTRLRRGERLIESEGKGGA